MALKKSLSLLFLIVFCKTFSQNIKSIQLKPLEINNFSTIIPLGKTLELSFDDLDADQKEYYYKIEHATFQWEPSDILSNEYIDGFNQNRIQEYENSFNTLQSYTHYKVQIPNLSTRIKKSGNYLISVLDEDDNVVFTRHFTLYENITNVAVSVVRSRDTKTINKQQTVQFVVNYNGININNPSQEIKVAVLQNNNWQTAITNLKPQFYKRQQLEYKYIKKSNFWGGNEFMNFDNKIIRNSNLHIANVVKKDIYHNYLYSQEIRAKKLYSYNPDINGQFVIRTLEGNNPNTEADYAMMHFALESKEIKNKEVYVYGAFNNYAISEDNKMKYNSEKGVYTSKILLKQGFYNYCFVTKDGDDIINLYDISGSFYETENEYTVLVYYRSFGEYYDIVIGVGTGFFNQKN